MAELTNPPSRTVAPATGAGVCGVVVTFNPALEALDTVVNAATKELNELIVIDNGSAPSNVRSIHQVLDRARRDTPSGCVILERFHSENRGLPLAFNEAIALAKDHRHEFLLLLDHDSVLLPGTVRKLVEAYERWNHVAPIGAVEAVNVEPVRLPTDDFLEGFFARRTAALGGELSEDYLITNSGLLLPLSVVAKVGGFDESYFVDAVDFEFGLRLRSFGWRVYRVASAQIRHQRGEPAEPISSPKKPPVRKVAPERHYYVARDVIRTVRTYGRKYPLIGLVLLSMPIREALAVALFYSERRRHLQNISLGILHGLEGRRGKLS